MCVCRHEREAAAAMEVPSLSIQEFHDLCHDFWHAHGGIFFSLVCVGLKTSEEAFHPVSFADDSARTRVANRSTPAAHPLPLCNS